MREKIAQIHNNTQRSYCDVYCDDSLACNSQGGCRMPGACNIQNFLTLRLALLTNQIARILLGVVQKPIDLMHWRHKGSHLHNNDASLVSRSAHVLCAGSAHWHSASQCAGPGGPARRCGLQGLPPWLHAWRWRTWQCFVWPPTQLGALLWRHMHMVYLQTNFSLKLETLHPSRCLGRLVVWHLPIVIRRS